MGLIFILFFAGVALTVVQSAHRSANAAWRAAGEHLQLHHTPGSMFNAPQLSGTIRGIAIRVEVDNRRQRGGSGPTTVYSADHRAQMTPRVTFRRQHSASFLRQIVGGHDMVVGDPRFDDSIVVDSQDGSAIAAYLTPARRAAILSIFSTWRDVDLNDRGLSVAIPGRVKNAAEIVSTVNRLVDSCRVLAEHESLDAALAHRDDGELHVAAAALHELNADPDPNVVTQILEAETLVASGESVRAVEIINSVTHRLPEDAEVDRWRDLLAPADAATTPPETPPILPALDQQSVIDDLFADSRYGVQIDARFTEAFDGREITWSGEVENSRPYRSDADFGTEPGTKTMVDIGAVGSSRLMSNQVKAVIDLPDGTTLARGDQVTFRGTLLHVDRFTRRFYVRDAVMV